MNQKPERQFSIRDLQRQIGDVQYAAMRGPVGLTHHGKTRFVLMSIDTYEDMTSRRDPQTAHLTAEGPQAHFSGALGAEMARITTDQGSDHD
jgi:prevent-host-death family protein